MPLASRISPITARPASSRPLGDGSVWTWFAEEDGPTYAATEGALRALGISFPGTLAATLVRIRAMANGDGCPALVTGSERRAGIGLPPGPLGFRLLPV